MIKISVVSKCPYCGHKMDVVALKCPVCGTGVTGQFVLDEFFNLSEEQMKFVKIFLKHKGNLSEVQKELDISYPTARNRLNEIVRTLGYDVEEEPKESEKDILERLRNGEIDISTAISKLKGGKDEGNQKI
ncbi:MAG: DUF2089 domain-containing protein [Athalassotoga sp.]|uniref:DUF2089 domain-containing protein n=1 Tax=Athalassotoga sp. TaxID=2022597 RepID=UPI00268C60D1